MMLIDFSAQTISPTKIKTAGYGGVVAYVSESRPGTHFGAKPMTSEYADALREAGLVIFSTASLVDRRRRTSPVGSTAGLPTHRRRCICTRMPAVLMMLQSSSASTKISMSRRGTVLALSGFGA
jgi:hypothetical protein